jgi:hypothetical protein
MIILKDTSLSEILDFLDAADQHGKNIPTVIESSFLLFVVNKSTRRAQ